MFTSLGSHSLGFNVVQDSFFQSYDNEGNELQQASKQQQLNHFTGTGHPYAALHPTIANDKRERHNSFFKALGMTRDRIDPVSTAAELDPVLNTMPPVPVCSLSQWFIEALLWEIIKPPCGSVSFILSVQTLNFELMSPFLLQ